MRIYYEKQKFIVILLNFLAFLAFIAAIFFASIFGLQHYRIIYDYLEYQNQIQVLAIACLALFIFLFLLSKIVKKRKNIRFDGKTIKFCINNYVESEFDLRKIDELFKYRSSSKIEYGYQDALAFRFHKNDIWESIDSSYTNKKTKEKSNVLISEINQAYAYIKSQRVIKEMSPSQGIRFRYLTLDETKEVNYDTALMSLEKTFDSYTNTYGDFNLDRLVITNDSLYYNRDKIASIKTGCFVAVKKIKPDSKKFLSSEKILFLNRRNELIISIDTTRVVNNELFKTMVLSIFPLKTIDDKDIIYKETKVLENPDQEQPIILNSEVIVDEVNQPLETEPIKEDVEEVTAPLEVETSDQIDAVIEEEVVNKEVVLERQPRKRKRRNIK